MEAAQKALLSAVRKGTCARCQAILDENLKLDPNWTDRRGTAALHVAAERGHPGIVQLLLLHPRIDVNLKDRDGATPLYLAAWHARLPVLQLLLRDPRVDANVSDAEGRTALWVSAFYGRLDAVKLLIASGKELRTDVKGRYHMDNRRYVPSEIARICGHFEITALLKRLKDSGLSKCRTEVAQEVGWFGQPALLFSLVVLYSHDFITLKPGLGHGHSAFRFLSILKRLPVPIQAVVCYRIFDSSRSRFRPAEREAVFAHVIKSYQESEADTAEEAAQSRRRRFLCF